jgi:hypothetical protein
MRDWCEGVMRRPSGPNRSDCVGRLREARRRWLDGRLVAVGGAAAAGVALVRSRYLRWGATDEELQVALPGDELVPAAVLRATRAVTVGAVAGEVWPWMAQLGQGRGGFYSYIPRSA